MMTEFIPAFLVGIFGVSGGSGHDPGRMLLIVRRPYAYVENRLRQAFAGRDDVEIIADRRRDERRVSSRPIQDERRQTSRRRAKDEILEIVITGDPFTVLGIPREDRDN